ncbi:hypothetical protein BDV93DRAFT_565349 [Ceratobasidium sp. AG-I]|nr:hypothetical protein BDV93DRAFT_565349 [Ceratobasidium sp. AG-I]
MTRQLHDLGSAYELRSDARGSVQDAHIALQYLQKAAESPAEDPDHKFKPALQWARLCDKHFSPSLLKAYQRAMSLLPQVVWLGNAVGNRYSQIIDAGTVTTEAAAAAIKTGGYGLALEWLEEGRSIVWKQMLYLRTDPNDLAAVSPTLATELRQVAQELDHLSSPRPTEDPAPPGTICPEHADHCRRRLAESWEELVDKVRSLPGFEAFMRPLKAAELMYSAKSGPVVVVNVHKTPVSRKRNLTPYSSSVDQLPHITWCTAGPLSYLPIHAPGDYESQSMVFDYTISSYTPTLSALLLPLSTPNTFPGILAVGQSSTPNMAPLPGTSAELSQIQDKSQGLDMIRLDEHLATPAAVLAGLEEHSWVHMACHAIQRSINPMQSAFYLHGGMLTLAEITQKRLKQADFAFLSACQTATGDENLPDEAVHLAAGRLMAGYRTVIATMWAIGDNDAPLVAEAVYELLLEEGKPDARREAVALHKAMGQLRATLGMKAFVKWVPYIHIGL